MARSGPALNSTQQGIIRFWQAPDDGLLTRSWYLWQTSDSKVARIRRSRQTCSKNGRKRHTLRQKGHRLGPATRDGRV